MDNRAIRKAGLWGGVWALLVATATFAILNLGCGHNAETVTSEELRQKIGATGINSAWTGTWYMGSKDGYHYFYDEWQDLIPDRTYRVLETEMTIQKPCPFSGDRKKWRTWPPK